MKVSEAINQLKVGDIVWVKGEVERIDKYSYSPLDVIFLHECRWFSEDNEISLTEPVSKKVEVPVYVAEFYEKYKDDLERALVGLMITVYEIGAKSEIEKWFSNSSNHPIETLIRMKDGYTVKPKRWAVKEELMNGMFFRCFKHGEELSGVFTEFDFAHVFTDKSKAEAVATLVEGSVEEV